MKQIFQRIIAILRAEKINSFYLLLILGFICYYFLSIFFTSKRSEPSPSTQQVNTEPMEQATPTEEEQPQKVLLTPNSEPKYLRSKPYEEFIDSVTICNRGFCKKWAIEDFSSMICKVETDRDIHKGSKSKDYTVLLQDGTKWKLSRGEVKRLELLKESMLSKGVDAIIPHEAYLITLESISRVDLEKKFISLCCECTHVEIADNGDGNGKKFNQFIKSTTISQSKGFEENKYLDISRYGFFFIKQVRGPRYKIEIDNIVKIENRCDGNKGSTIWFRNGNQELSNICTGVMPNTLYKYLQTQGFVKTDQTIYPIQ